MVGVERECARGGDKKSSYLLMFVPVFLLTLGRVSRCAHNPLLLPLSPTLSTITTLRLPPPVITTFKECMSDSGPFPPGAPPTTSCNLGAKVMVYSQHMHSPRIGHMQTQRGRGAPQENSK
jgi:hypothetical protein